MHITEKQLKLITEVASEKAIEAYNEYMNKKAKEKHDRRLRNTKLLLKNYRTFVLHCSEVKMDIDEIEQPKDILDELERDENAIESIKKSKERTLIMVNFINSMLSVYKALCERSIKPEEQRRYDVVYKMYIATEESKAEDIATCHNIETRTVYRDVNKACNTLSGLIFGVDSIRFYD
ncbi:hypothetical protein [Gracilibacillus lacisalsi]|uniref:hypothetical protein n=1 Tax=Gracilibacillus lacisalsi TaxID=393087 RepID=UPI0003685593|nr:hypothetical protein [Gracilibacillus lacisalsi]